MKWFALSGYRTKIWLSVMAVLFTLFSSELQEVFPSNSSRNRQANILGRCPLGMLWTQTNTRPTLTNAIARLMEVRGLTRRSARSDFGEPATDPTSNVDTPSTCVVREHTPCGLRQKQPIACYLFLAKDVTLSQERERLQPFIYVWQCNGDAKMCTLSPTHLYLFQYYFFTISNW